MFQLDMFLLRRFQSFAGWTKKRLHCDNFKLAIVCIAINFLNLVVYLIQFLCAPVRSTSFRAFTFLEMIFFILIVLELMLFFVVTSRQIELEVPEHPKVLKWLLFIFRSLYLCMMVFVCTVVPTRLSFFDAPALYVFWILNVLFIYFLSADKNFLPRFQCEDEK